MKTALFWFAYVFVVCAFIHTVLSWIRIWVEVFRKDDKHGD